jgi:hypothetical protein
MTRILSLNASAKLLYEQLSGREFTAEDAARMLSDTYGIGEEEALQDARKWMDALIENGIAE